MSNANLGKILIRNNILRVTKTTDQDNPEDVISSGETTVAVLLDSNMNALQTYSLTYIPGSMMYYTVIDMSTYTDDYYYLSLEVVNIPNNHDELLLVAREINVVIKNNYINIDLNGTLNINSLVGLLNIQSLTGSVEVKKLTGSVNTQDLTGDIEVQELKGDIKW
jgi:hypothetical protein